MLAERYTHRRTLQSGKTNTTGKLALTKAKVASAQNAENSGAVNTQT